MRAKPTAARKSGVSALRAMSVGPLGLPPFAVNTSYFGCAHCCSPHDANDQPKLLCFRSITAAMRFIRWLELLECALQLLIVLLAYWLLFGSGGLSTNSYVLPALWIFYVTGGGTIAVMRLQQAVEHRDPNLFSAYIAYKRTGLVIYASLAVLALSFVTKQADSEMLSTEAAVILASSSVILELSVLTLIYVQRCKAYYRATEEICIQVTLDRPSHCSALPPSYEEAHVQPPTYEQALRQQTVITT